MSRLVAVLVAALVLVSGWFYLDHRAIAAQRDRAEARAATLAGELRLSEREAEQARRDYADLDRSLTDLQAVKQQVRVVTQEHKVYIKEAVAGDSMLEQYLDQPLPVAVECVLAESCGGHASGVR